MDGYNSALRSRLREGFTYGFHLGCQDVDLGRNTTHFVGNHTSAERNPVALCKKLDEEITSRRVMGPFSKPPFGKFHISPLGLVPKKDGTFRLIHNLSSPEGNSLNETIPTEFPTVHYQTLDDAIDLILDLGAGSFLAKSDIRSAFRLIPVHPEDYHLLGFTWQGKYYYDRSLPMGASSSCFLFELFSSPLHWILEHKFHLHLCHVLDDFLFVFPCLSENPLPLFQSLCLKWGIPLHPDKTQGPSTTLDFVGITLDSMKMEARLPSDKLTNLRSVIDQFLGRNKATLKEIQSLIGLLNFACKVVAPGRAFLRRVIDLTRGLQKSHHRRRITAEAKLDFLAWKEFLKHFNGVSLLVKRRWSDSESLSMYTDASDVGFGCILGNSWTYGTWPATWKKFNIAVREFFPIVLAVHLWGTKFKDMNVTFFCDNLAVVEILKKQTSRDPGLMRLLRQLVVFAMRNNLMFSAQHIRGTSNIAADDLSRLQIHKFLQDHPLVNRHATPIPPHLMPLA